MQRLMVALSVVLVMSLMPAMCGAAVPTPIIDVGFNEGSGAVAVNNGSAGGELTLTTPVPAWSSNVPAGVGGPSSVDFGTAHANYCVESPANYSQLTGLTKFTITGWVNCRNSTEGSGGNRLVTWINHGGEGVDVVYKTNGSVQVGIDQWPDGVPAQSSGGKIPTDPAAGVDNWRFFAVTYDSTLAGGHVKFYFGSSTEPATFDVAKDYARGSVGTNISRLCIGHFNVATRSTALDRMFRGLIDEVKVFGDVLDLEQIQQVQSGDPEIAKAPNPANEAQDVWRDVALSWEPGTFAQTHDVYLGTSLEDVDAASRQNPLDVLVSQGQTAAVYQLGSDAVFEYGRTYYWRIDEVNAAPDNTIFKGDVWSFTVEPYAYPLADVTATASSAQAGMGPENTINGSGLSDADEHSTDLKQMWMATGTGKPDWIQYEFAGVQKLHEMWVWNSNQLLESILGFGAKSVTIEYSADGQTWTTLEGVSEFAKAASSPTYTANTVVSFDGAMAKYVKLTINSNWGGAVPQTGLSEVRFFSVPVQAREPQPSPEATSVDVDAELSWRPGREAVSHTVYIGADSNAVAKGTVPAETTADYRFTPASLDFATTYYWRVDEVGDAGTYAGDVWSFTTEEFAPIDDFEAYNDDDNRIYNAWVDGVTTQASGSQVGYDESPFAEKTFVHGGAQAMPLMYDNTASPYYSEAEFEFETPTNLTVSGAQNLRLFYRGVSPSFVETASGSILMNGVGADIWGTADQFRFAYKSLSGNGSIVARVNSLFNSNTWAKAGVMIRQSVEPGSTHAFMAKTAVDGNGASFQRRLAAAGESANNDAPTAVAAPYWVKVDRTGDKFTAYTSPDGVAWTQLGEAQTIPMSGSVLIGLAVCSHDAAIVTSADFSDVQTTGNVTGNWQIAAIGAEQPEGNSPEAIYVTVKDSSGKSKTVVNPDTAATGRTGWQEWLISLSDFTSAGVKMTAVDSIVIGVGNRTSPTAGGAGILYIDDLGYGTSLP